MKLRPNGIYIIRGAAGSGKSHRINEVVATAKAHIVATFAAPEITTMEHVARVMSIIKSRSLRHFQSGFNVVVIDNIDQLPSSPITGALVQGLSILRRKKGSRFNTVILTAGEAYSPILKRIGHTAICTISSTVRSRFKQLQDHMPHDKALVAARKTRTAHAAKLLVDTQWDVIQTHGGSKRGAGSVFEATQLLLTGQADMDQQLQLHGKSRIHHLLRGSLVNAYSDLEELQVAMDHMDDLDLICNGLSGDQNEGMGNVQGKAAAGATEGCGATEENEVGIETMWLTSCMPKRCKRRRPRILDDKVRDSYGIMALARHHVARCDTGFLVSFEEVHERISTLRHKGPNASEWQLFDNRDRMDNKTLPAMHALLNRCTERIIPLPTVADAIMNRMGNLQRDKDYDVLDMYHEQKQWWVNVSAGTSNIIVATRPYDGKQVPDILKGKVTHQVYWALRKENATERRVAVVETHVGLWCARERRLVMSKTVQQQIKAHLAQRHVK